MKQILRIKFWIIAIICLTFALSSEEVFARGGHGGGHGGGNRGGGFAGRHSRYYYRGGSWYRHGWLGGDIAFSALTIGALIESLPPRCTTVVYEGMPYYYYDGYYYRPYPEGGYIVVQPPVAAPVVAAPEAVSAPAAIPTPPAAQPPAQTQLPETLIVNIPNSKGEYTKVTLKKSGNGFVGPQGEYYEGHPTVERLKVLYGK